MYLASFPRALGRLGLDAKAMAYYREGNWDGVDPLQCERQGGLVTVSYTQSYRGPAEYGYRPPPEAHFGCRMPEAAPAPVAAPAPTINVAVPTNVQTQVSPQISPVFVQQEKPVDSPVNAATAQVIPTGQTGTVVPAPERPDIPTGTTGASPEYLQYLREQQAIEAEREKRDAEERAKIYDLIMGTAEQATGAEGEAAPAPPPPVMSAPPIDFGAPPPETPAPVSAGFVPSGFSNPATLAIIAAAGVAVFALMRGGKANAKRK